MSFFRLDTLNKCFTYVSPDGKWRPEPAKQMLNVLNKVLSMLSEIKMTYLIAHSYYYL